MKKGFKVTIISSVICFVAYIIMIIASYEFKSTSWENWGEITFTISALTGGVAATFELVKWSFETFIDNLKEIAKKFKKEGA